MAKTADAKKGRENVIVQYFRETWFELKKVSWPTWRETVNLTVIVVLVTTFLALVLGLLDWFYSFVFGFFL